MANDTSKTGPGVETEPAPPSQTPYSGFPGYEEFRIGDPIPGMPGSYVGGEIVNDNGDRWNWIKGEWDYAGSGSEETKAVTPPRLDQPQTIFGPVTASGYAQPPVDPLSYYSTPEPTPEPTPYTGGPTRWTEVYRPTVDLSNVQTFTPAPTPVSTPAPQPTPSPVQSQPTYSSEGEDSGVSLITPENRDRYTREGGMDLQGPSEPTPVNPLPETSIPKAEDVDTNTFTGVVTNPVQGGEKPYYIEDTGVPGTIESKPFTPGLVPLDKPQITFPIVTTPVSQTAPTRVQAIPYQGKPVTNPLIEPTTIPVATRRMIEAISPGYFKDINYDPDEILAAAMRSMGGRQARRSILSEMR
jgi:hypothetical protein